jgi:preprotein translocase subunit SecA
MRELRRAGLARTEGGEQPKLTIKVPSDLPDGEGLLRRDRSRWQCDEVMTSRSALQRRTCRPLIASYHSSSGKIGRNDPCPCGSGRKYKKCCGLN